MDQNGTATAGPSLHHDTSSTSHQEAAPSTVTSAAPSSSSSITTSSNANAPTQATVPPTLSCKDFLAQMGPIDMLLGSVSYSEIDSVEGKIQQLRTSARVFKKMKIDQSNAQAIQDKKDAAAELKAAEELQPVVKEPVKKPTPNPMWTVEEKKIFFEALNEFGKDFENIHLYYSTKLKKKAVPEDAIKNKYQIRHFYYRTVHLLSNCIKFSEGIPKNAQELYALINYGEMRRKLGSVQKKNWSKLNELVHNGSVAIRYKGKTVRIKTPMCRALRRLNQLDEKYDDLKLPTRVFVDLKPKDMVSYLRVQSMAQNPRIRVALPLQKRLSSLITCVSQRWRTSEAVVYDKAVIPTNPITKDCVPDPKQIEANALCLKPFLRLTPPLEANIELPSIDISEYFTGQSIGLTAFETRKGVRQKPLEEKEPKKEEMELVTVKAEKSPIKDEPCNSGSTTTDSDKDLEKSPQQQQQQNKSDVTKVVDDAVNIILSLRTASTSEPTAPSTSTISNVKSTVHHHHYGKKEDRAKDSEPVVLSPKMLEEMERKRQHAEQVRKGWTLENCGSLTIGEIYLMFGSDSKMQLEYSWDSTPDFKPKLEKDDELSSEPMEIDGDSSAQTKTTTGSTTKSPATITYEKKSLESTLSTPLRKLLSLAKLQQNNSTMGASSHFVRCPCGHVCGGSTAAGVAGGGGKNAVQDGKFKKPLSTKVTKKNQQQQTLVTATGQETKTQENFAQNQSQQSEMSSENDLKSSLPSSSSSTNNNCTAPSSSSTNKSTLDGQQNSYNNNNNNNNNNNDPQLFQKQTKNSNNSMVLQQIFTELSTLQRLNLRCGNKRSRSRLVVERNLVPSGEECGKNHHIVSLDIIKQETPGRPPPQPSLLSGTSGPLSLSKDGAANKLSSCSSGGAGGGPSTSSSVQSTTHFSNNNNNNSNSNNNNDNSAARFADARVMDETINELDLLDDQQTNQSNLSVTGLSRILSEGAENQWYNSEVADYSLSSLLGQLETRTNQSTTTTIGLSTDDTQLSKDVDAQLRTLMTETSLDFTAKFADLAAQVVDKK